MLLSECFSRCSMLDGADPYHQSAASPTASMDSVLTSEGDIECCERKHAFLHMKQGFLYVLGTRCELSADSLCTPTYNYNE